MWCRSHTFLDAQVFTIESLLMKHYITETAIASLYTRKHAALKFKLCVFLATSYQDTGQEQQVSRAESIKMQVTQFKSVQIKLKNWKLAVRFFICSWPQKGMKFYMWHRTRVEKGHPIWLMRFSHSLLPSHQTRFDLPTKNGFQWTS